MRKFFNLSTYTLLLFIALAFTGCQEEFEPVNEADSTTAFRADSETAAMISNTAAFDGSFDNIADGASCFAVKFPYTVNVNGIDITIDSREDLHLIEEIFDELSDDINSLEFLFPITITLADFAEVVINSPQELAELARECREGGDDDDIECIDFVYPITLFTFDVNNQQTGSVTVNNDMELRRFFKDRGEDELVGIDYPVTMIKYDGSEVMINSNQELAAALDRAREECDEDDDNDHDDDDYDEVRLAHLLTECPWYVREFVRDGIDNSEQYLEYLMVFSEEGYVMVKDREGNVINGEWDLRTTDTGVAIILAFDILVDFNLEWKVYELEEGKIKLYGGEGNRIVMKMACGSIDYDPDSLREILKECSWIIRKVRVDGEPIDRVIGYELKFMAENMVTLSKGDIVYEGTWEIGVAAEGGLVMAVNINGEEGVNFEWPLREMLQNRLKFSLEEYDYVFLLERVCADNETDGDVSEIRNILMGGGWMVASYTYNDMDGTAEFEGLDFDFGADHEIIVSTNMDPIYTGLWRVIRNSEGKLKVYLNFGDDTSISTLTNDWKLESISADRVELIHVDDQYTEVLVFEK